MKILAAACALLGTGLLAGVPRPADDSQEPPQLFSLEVGGKRVPLEVDRPVDLETRAPSTRVTLRLEPHRVFDFAGVRFHYPREMAFEADLEEPSVSIWSLNGSQTVLMVHRYRGQEDPAFLRRQVVERMLAQYGKGNASQRPAKVVLEKRELEGVEILADIAGSRISQTACSFRSGKDSILLILQDSLKDDGGHTKEYVRLLEMTGATLEFPGE